jgi:hypothetical protein
VVSGTPRCRDTAVTPPSSLMISNAVIPPCYQIRSVDAIGFTNISVDGRYESVHSEGMLSKGELLAALAAKGVSNADIQRVLDMPSSRVSEILRATPGKETTLKPRELTYDEGAKLVRAFLPELNHSVPPLPVAILRLLVLHIAKALDCTVPEEQLTELAEDLRAFSEYASDPKVRGNAEASEAFFRALQLRR